MTNATPKIGFRQYPTALKFVVVWISLLAWYNLIRFLITAFGSLSIDMFAFFQTFIYFIVSSGLKAQQNEARIWGSIVIGVGSLFRVAILISMLFSWSLSYEIYVTPVTHSQKIFLLVLNLIFNAIILYILLRPSTKALFTPPPSPEPTLQQTV